MNPPPEPGPGRTAVQCLAAIAHRHGVPVTPERLEHEFALGPGEPPTALLVRMAESVGLKARAAHLGFEELAALDGVFPLLARLANGNSIVIAGVRRNEADWSVMVVDPLASQGKGLVLAREQFCSSWKGEVVFLKRIHRLLDPHQPFSLAWFLPEMMRERTAFRDVAIAVLALHVIALVVPIYFQLVIDKVLVHRSQSTLYVLTAGVAIALLFEAAFGFLRQYLLLRATNKIDMRVARRTFGHLLSLPIDFFESSSAGVLVRHMQQTDRIRAFLTGKLFLTALDATALVVFLPVLVLYSVKLTLVVLGFTAAILVVVAALVGPFRRRLRELYEAEAERQGMLVESIHGMRTVKALTIEPVQRRKWEQKTSLAIATHWRVGTVSISAQSVTTLLERLMLVAIVGLGAQDVFDLKMTVGALVAFQMLAGRVLSPLVQIVSLVHEYQETALSVRMLGEIMNRPSERSGVAGGLQPALAGAIAFDRVTFRYPGTATPALAGLSLSIPAGTVIGVVGRSGSGKTTLARLIQGMYAIDEGVVRFDGVDAREIDLAHLRRQIGVVLQESFVFRGTVRENISASRPDASFEAIVEAARAAGADEFVERLPRGYDTQLEEGGENLSGGQRQRLAIARALLTQPRILILDEAASALDPESEALFLHNLERIARGRTVVMISHRLLTLTRADAIVVLHEGRMLDCGTHRELLGRCEQYGTLWRQQHGYQGEAPR